jgi:hypothetical protein
MVEKTKLILRRATAKLRSVVADSQYSEGKIRNVVGRAVIPYPANQKRKVRGLPPKVPGFLISIVSSNMYKSICDPLFE